MTTIRFSEVKELLATRKDEIELVELLQLSSFDLVETFEDQLEALWLSGRLDTFINDESPQEDDELPTDN